MKTIKIIFDFYINSYLHVALAVYALSWISLLEFGMPYNAPILYFIFYATICGYNFVRHFDMACFCPERISQASGVLQIIYAVIFLLVLYYYLLLSTPAKCLAVILGLITFWYAMPILPRLNYAKKQKNLRQVRGVKIYVIALVWTSATVLLPLFNIEAFSFNIDVGITFLQRYLFVIALMLPFEIRDLSWDSKKLATIPQLIGVKRTKWLGFLILLIYLLLNYIRTNLTQKQLVIYSIISVVIALFLWFSKQKQTHYFTSFWVEGIPIFWMLLLLL